MDNDITPSREKAASALKNAYNDKVLKVAFGNALKQAKQGRNRPKAELIREQVTPRLAIPVNQYEDTKTHDLVFTIYKE